MESLSIGLSSSPAFHNQSKTPKPISKVFPSTPNSISLSDFFNSDQSTILSQRAFPLLNSLPQLNTAKARTHHTHLFHLSFLCTGLSFPLCCFASDSAVPPEQVSNKINLEAVLVSIDEFFNRYPFFVAGVTFIWLVVIPLTQEYLQKYKFISAINAFRKLRDDPNAQLLDIRDKKSLQYMGSPNLKILNKNAAQVEFYEGDEEGFVKKVLEKFPESANTVICILDNFDGNSMKIAELLFKNGFKEAYAIRGGIRGKNGWQEIQETLLPPSVHVSPKKKVKNPPPFEMNGGVNQPDNNSQATSSTTIDEGRDEKPDNGYVIKSSESTVQANHGSRPLSPYPNYPDLRPPSSPTPSKPCS